MIINPKVKKAILLEYDLNSKKTDQKVNKKFSKLEKNHFFVSCGAGTGQYFQYFFQYNQC